MGDAWRPMITLIVPDFESSVRHNFNLGPWIKVIACTAAEEIPSGTDGVSCTMNDLKSCRHLLRTQTDASGDSPRQNSYIVERGQRIGYLEVIVIH